MFDREIIEAAKQHALSDWPREAVGYVVDGRYEPKVNAAPDPVVSFHVKDEWHDGIDAVIHSHSLFGAFDLHRRAPSKLDMECQLATDVPWGITVTNGKVVSDPVWLGPHNLDLPLVGREFIPGITDCYELVRAWWWQKRGVELKSFPRDPDWWEGTRQSIIVDGFDQAGFRQIGLGEASEGDGLLMAIPSHYPVNHCAVMLGDGTMLHHRYRQVSKIEPWSNSWRALTHMAVRHVKG